VPEGHAAQAVEPAGEYLPCAQLPQAPAAVAPDAIEKVPAVQFVQENEPWLEVYLPWSQVAQVAAAVDPEAVEKVPAAQPEQEVAPLAVE
jgi:hypothetical protein